MKRALVVFRRELAAAVESRVALVTIALFVVTQSTLFFFVGYPIGPRPLPGLWRGGQANLSVLFAWLPLALALLVPALTMGAWSEERRAGTEELLFTFPVRAGEIVFGKFLAAWVQLLALIVLSIAPIAIAVDRLGPLDWGTALGGTLGAALMAAGYVALALCVSAAVHEQLVAFLCGALLLCVAWLAPLLVGVLPAGLAAFVDRAAPASHFLDSAARGVLDLRDFLYFGLLTGLGLLVNVVVVEGRRWR